MLLGMSRYLYRIEVEFTARDDVQAREMANAVVTEQVTKQLMSAFPRQTMFMRTVAKLQRLIDGAPPRQLAKW